MARIYERPDAKLRWWLDYTGPDGRRVRCAGSNSKKVAAEMLQELVTKTRRVGLGIEEDRAGQPHLTVGGLRDKWLDDWGKTTRKGQERRSLATEEVRWRLLVSKLGENRLLAGLTKNDMEALAKAIVEEPRARGRWDDGTEKLVRGQARSAADVNRHRALLARALKVAQEKGYRVNASAIQGWSPRAEPARRTRTATPHEQKRILAAAEASDPALHLLLMLIYTGGFRLEEACGIEWRNVSLDERLVVLTRTKSGEGRVAAIPIETANALQAWKAKNGEAWEGRVFSPTFRTQNISHRLTKLKRELGLTDLRVAHDGRHTAASNMAKAGAPISTLMEQHGWRSWDVARRYLNPKGAELRAAVDGASSKRRRGPGPKP